jgi:hypothetical protein
MSDTVLAAYSRPSYVKQRQIFLVTTGLDPVVHADARLCQQRKI